MAAAPPFDRVALLGVGLINSSLARALRARRLARSLAGYSRRAETRSKIAALGIVDAVAADPAEAVAGADLIVLGVPVGANRAVARAMRPGLAPGAIVTDVGSVKQAVIDDVLPLLPEGVALVPGHPIAGTEHSGPEAGFAELFEGRWCILTPPAGTDPAAVGKMHQLWRRAGMMLEIMDPGHHDHVLAITSHLPHLIAFSIVGTAADLEQDLRQEVIKFAASGFRDFTRIAASDPVMWRDIFLNNREALLDVCGRLMEDIARLQRAIRWGEGEEIEKLIQASREIRRNLIDARQA